MSSGRDPYAREPDLCRTVPIPVAHTAVPIGIGTRGAQWGVSAVAELRTQPIMIPAAETAETKSAGGGGEGLALSISSALGALAGLASWLIAARLLPQAEVGLAAAVVSAFILIGGIGQLNLGLGLIRWLPV
jgi:hypothetical protein